MIRSFFNWWNNRLPLFGNLSLSMFFIAIISGIPLAIPFDVSHAFDSIQLFTLLSPAGVFYRSAHYWSGQLFILFTAIHVIEHLAKSSEKNVKSGIWVRLVLSIPITLFVMLTGFILKADSEGILARQVLTGLLSSIPIIGETLKRFFLHSAGDFQVIYAHHLATATIFLIFVIVEHARRIWPELLSFVYACAVVIILSIVLSPVLQLEATASVKGPWYFVGLRETLKWIPYPFPVITGVTAILVLLGSVKWVNALWGRRVKWFLGGVLLIYSILSIVNWFFRDNNWDLVFG